MSDERKDAKEEPIIIKKRRGHQAHGSHGGSWKVAYADFVTAMMAFFIVMWILGQSEQIKKSVTNYFEDPGAFNFVTGKRASPVDLNMVPEKGKSKSGNVQDGSKKDSKSKFFFVVPDKDSSKGSEGQRKEAIKDSIRASELVEKIEKEIRKFIENESITNPQMKEILSSIKIEMTKEGLRIELIESKEALFFEIGSAKIRPQAKLVLIRLAKEIGKLPNFVDVEGHTDSRQYSGKTTYSNWELSADRANSSRKVLEENGFWVGQIAKVIGFADRKLMNPDNPFDLSNRRVSILIRQLNVNDFIGAQK